MPETFGDNYSAPLRDQLEDAIREYVLSGRFKNERLPSVRELAAKYHVSVGTVSNALAKLKTQGILRTRKKKGIYISKSQDNPAARRSGNIGVLSQGSGDALRERMHFDTFNGARESAAARGYKVLYLGTRQTGEDDDEDLPFGIRDVDGIVYVIGDKPSMKVLRLVQSVDLPIVMTDWFDSALPIDGVLIHNINASVESVRHLLDLGHRRIAFINSMEGPSVAERLLGYKKALQEGGIAFDPALVRNSICDVNGGQTAMRALLPLEPTAVFAFNDFLAIGAMLEAQRVGMSVPRDLSVVGFGNQGEVLGQGIGKRLTTVIVDMQTMGGLAAKALFKRIEGYAGPAEIIRVPARLTVGDTTAKCAKRLKRKR
jgi:LacI family transcriptional regulator